MADQDRYSDDRDRLGQRDVYLDNRTGIGAPQRGHRAEWGRGGGRAEGRGEPPRYGDREQAYNQRRGENASFGEDDYGQADGGRTGYRAWDDDSRYGGRTGGVVGDPARYANSENYGQGRYTQSGSRYSAGDHQDRQSWASYPARSNPDFYADNNRAAGPGWAEEWDRRPSGAQRGQRRDMHSYEADYGRESGGGFWDRAADKVASWFGGEDSEGREARESHRGKGPKGYRRSDERIRDDVSDRLSDDHWLDASGIEVRVENCEVILSGTVKTRDDKRRAEHLAEQVSGVDNVQNSLRVERGDNRADQPWGDKTTGVPVTGQAGSTAIPGSTSDMGDLGTANAGKMGKA